MGGIYYLSSVLVLVLVCISQNTLHVRATRSLLGWLRPPACTRGGGDTLQVLCIGTAFAYQIECLQIHVLASCSRLLPYSWVWVRYWASSRPSSSNRDMTFGNDNHNCRVCVCVCVFFAESLNSALIDMIYKLNVTAMKTTRR